MNVTEEIKLKLEAPKFEISHRQNTKVEQNTKMYLAKNTPKTGRNCYWLCVKS